MKHDSETILLVGTGYMAKEYAKVLKAQKLDFKVVGRSEKSVQNFKKEIDIAAVSGGIEEWLKQNKALNAAIVAVTEDQLGIVTRNLINAGCKNVLVEKPGGLDANDIRKVAELAKRKKANVYIGYNRRFYASTQKALEITKNEGVKSFIFDFTERSYVVEKLPQSDKIKNQWFLQNSTHVIDMAFFLGGNPSKLASYKLGGLKWHPGGSIYAGAGVSDRKALFSYHANWESAGRWSLEIMTAKNKLIFRPLEKLQIQKYGSMSIEDIALNDKLDIEYKPGLYRQVEAFITNPTRLLTIEEQVKHLKTFAKINGYSK